MRAQRTRWIVPRNHKTIVALILLPVVLAGSVGVPVYPVVRKDKSRPFPCQDHACGCRDADSCWRNCCCMSKQEKLAWAARNSVTPPRFLLAKTDRQIGESRACDLRPSLHGSKRCCTASNGDKCEEHAVTDIVLLSARWKCQGLGFLMAVLDAALPCGSPQPWRRERGVCEVFAIFPRCYQFLKNKPPVPPPRRSIHAS